MNSTQHLQNPNNSHHSKPYYLIHKVSLDFHQPRTLQKKHYKYIHSIHINSPIISLKRIPKLKILHSLTFPKQPIINLRLLQKIIKPHQKYLRNIQHSPQNPKILKLLPLLAELDPGSDPVRWRLLVTRLGFKKLSFNMVESLRFPQQKIKFHGLLQKYKISLSRNLSKMKALESIQIRVYYADLEMALLILKILNQNERLIFLKDFNLTILSNLPPQNNPPPSSIAIPEVSKALSCLTSLTVPEGELYSLFLSTAGSLKNLTYLDLTMSPKESLIQSLSSLQDLQKLKKLDLSFTASSLTCERQFFENFTVPPAVEFLDFSLSNFTWSEIPLNHDNWQEIHDNFTRNPLYINFFEKLRAWQNLQDLFLNITGHPKTHNCPGLAGKFASLFVKQLSRLEKVKYSHSQPDIVEGSQVKPMKPMNLADFWKGLESSKDTLKSIFIQTSEAVIDTQIEMRFPKLQNLDLWMELKCETNLKTFWKSLTRVQKVNIQGLKVGDHKRLEEILDGMRMIDYKMIITVDVKGILDEVLVNCLKKYVEEVKVKGSLRMCIMNVEGKDEGDFEDILKLVVKKGCFEIFKMERRMNDYLFHVRFQNVNIVCNALAQIMEDAHA